MDFEEIEIDIKIKLSSKKELEIFISKQKELTKTIETLSDLLPYFSQNIEIDKSSNIFYTLTGEDDLGKFAVLSTIIEEIADLLLDLDNTPT